MTRLTNILRDKIVENALTKAGVTKRLKASESALEQWGEDVRVDLLGGKVKADDLAIKRNQVREIADGIDASLRSTSDIFYGRKEVSLNMAGVRVKAKFPAYGISPQSGTLLSDNPLVQRYYDLRAIQEKVEAEHDNISAQVRATVYKFGSVKRLLEAWPEAKELLPEILPEAKSQLPAIQVADLNALVGLPSGDD